MADTLSALRSLMSSHSPPLHALVVPSEDYHQVNLINYQLSLSFQFLILSSNLILILFIYAIIIVVICRVNMYLHVTSVVHLFLDSLEVLVSFNSIQSIKFTMPFVFLFYHIIY